MTLSNPIHIPEILVITCAYLLICGLHICLERKRLREWGKKIENARKNEIDDLENIRDLLQQNLLTNLSVISPNGQEDPEEQPSDINRQNQTPQNSNYNSSYLHSFQTTESTNSLTAIDNTRHNDDKKPIHDNKGPNVNIQVFLSKLSFSSQVPVQAQGHIDNVLELLRDIEDKAKQQKSKLEEGESYINDQAAKICTLEEGFEGLVEQINQNAALQQQATLQNQSEPNPTHQPKSGKYVLPISMDKGSAEDLKRRHANLGIKLAHLKIYNQQQWYIWCRCIHDWIGTFFDLPETEPGNRISTRSCFNQQQVAGLLEFKFNFASLPDNENVSVNFDIPFQNNPSGLINVQHLTLVATLKDDIQAIQGVVQALFGLNMRVIDELKQLEIKAETLEAALKDADDVRRNILIAADAESALAQEDKRILLQEAEEKIKKEKAISEQKINQAKIAAKQEIEQIRAEVEFDKRRDGATVLQLAPNVIHHYDELLEIKIWLETQWNQQRDAEQLIKSSRRGRSILKTLDQFVFSPYLDRKPQADAMGNPSVIRALNAIRLEQSQTIEFLRQTIGLVAHAPEIDSLIDVNDESYEGTGVVHLDPQKHHHIFSIDDYIYFLIEPGKTLQTTSFRKTLCKGRVKFYYVRSASSSGVGAGRNKTTPITSNEEVSDDSTFVNEDIDNNDPADKVGSEAHHQPDDEVTADAHGQPASEATSDEPTTEEFEVKTEADLNGGEDVTTATQPTNDKSALTSYPRTSLVKITVTTKPLSNYLMRGRKYTFVVDGDWLRNSDQLADTYQAFIVCGEEETLVEHTIEHNPDASLSLQLPRFEIPERADFIIVRVIRQDGYWGEHKITLGESQK